MENKDQVLNSGPLESATANKEINVEISSEDIRVLKDGSYMLCIAKKIGDRFNVVWKSYSNYLMSNTFSYIPDYQLFGTNLFQSGVTVYPSTNNQNCRLGQTCVLDKYGRMNPAFDGGSITALHFNNEYGPIQAGVNQILHGIDGKRESLPVYVSERQLIFGINDLTPKESVLIWFERNVQTSHMFSTSRSNAIELDLTNQNGIRCLYNKGKWSLI